MSATCKTCGGTLPNHKPSQLDAQGIGHTDHRMTNKRKHIGDNSLAETIEGLFASAWQDGVHHLNPYIRRDSELADRVMRLVRKDRERLLNIVEEIAQSKAGKCTGESCAGCELGRALHQLRKEEL